jgi:hypothetical protein
MQRVHDQSPFTSSSIQYFQLRSSSNDSKHCATPVVSAAIHVVVVLVVVVVLL